MDIESIISASSRVQQANDSALGNCSKTWHVGFFFDGIHRNVEQDAPEHRLSNIARLFRAFPDLKQNTSHESYDAFYISGLGTPFRENAESKLHSIMDEAQGSIIDDLQGQPEDLAKEKRSGSYSALLHQSLNIPQTTSSGWIKPPGSR